MSETYPRLRRGVLELTLVLALYLGYSLSRLVASDAFAPARRRALQLLDLETLLGIRWEEPINQLFSAHRVLGLFGSYWYATAHYVITAIALVWVYRRGSHAYLPARRALLISTILGLAAYLVLPTAPPRMFDGYVDVLSLHAADGWWGGDASAPRGLGGLTNQLAAFPSLHAGWALWVAVVVQQHAASRWVRGLGWTYAGITAVVIVGTGNHWVIDAVVGWMVVLAGFPLAAVFHRWRTRERTVLTPAGASPEDSALVE